MKPQVVIFTFALIFVTCWASLPPAKLYWNLMLPNATMPKAIHDRLMPGPVEYWGVKKIHPDICLYYIFFPICAYSNVIKGKDDPMTNLFFKENDLKLGTNKSFYLINSSNNANFLPLKVEDLDLLTSKNITTTINLLLSKPASLEAKDMRNTINMCKMSFPVGEHNLCATSLEAMIDFVISRLGRNVEAVISKTDSEAKLQSYSITSLKNMKNQRSVVCHKLTYPYAVYKCHSAFSARAYKVSLASANGRKMINVGAVCHLDTSRWSPKHLAFKLLNVEPGTISICHLIPGDHIVWVPNELSK